LVIQVIPPDLTVQELVFTSFSGALDCG
jgi:hypothetical protein